MGDAGGGFSDGFDGVDADAFDGVSEVSGDGEVPDGGF